MTVNTLLDQAIKQAEMSLEQNTSDKDLVYRVKLLKQYKEQGGVLHKDGCIRYSNKYTLLGYE